MEMSQITDQIKKVLQDEIRGAEADVYEVNGDLLIEVIASSFASSDYVSSQNLVHQVLTAKGVLGQKFVIQELFTYTERSKSYNELAHLHVVDSGHRGGMFTSTLAAGDAYVYLAEIDAARLKYGWRHRDSGEPISCRAIQADKGSYASFQLNESANYRELEIDGEIHRIRGLKRGVDNVWVIDATIGGGFADGYALG
jgi:hypothetical protein